MKGFIIGAVMATLSFTTQADEPNSAHDGAEWQIWAYSSAAPAPLGSNATVLGLDGSVLREGSNGWTCMVGTSGAQASANCRSGSSAKPLRRA